LIWHGAAIESGSKENLSLSREEVKSQISYQLSAISFSADA
jgi:hypothetical protein